MRRNGPSPSPRSLRRPFFISRCIVNRLSAFLLLVKGTGNLCDFPRGTSTEPNLNGSGHTQWTHTTPNRTFCHLRTSHPSHSHTRNSTTCLTDLVGYGPRTSRRDDTTSMSLPSTRRSRSTPGRRGADRGPKLQVRKDPRMNSGPEVVLSIPEVRHPRSNPPNLFHPKTHVVG